MKKNSGLRLEWIAAIVLTLASVFHFAVRAYHAGGLWRDEAGPLQLARLTSWSEMARLFEFEGFPLLFPALLRLSSNVFGTSDAALRAFGFGMGLLLLAAFWLYSLQLHGRPPTLSIGVAGLNATVIIEGSSLRGYGIATVCLVLTAVAVGRLLQKPTRGRGCAAAVSAILSVQFLLHNSVLVGALCFGAISAALLARQAKAALLVFLGGLAAAFSLLPYLDAYAGATAWTGLAQHRPSWALRGQSLLEALGPAPIGWLWAAGAGVVIALGIVRLWTCRREAEESAGGQHLSRFGLFSFLSGLVAFVVFLQLVGLGPHLRYFCPLIALLGLSLETAAVYLPGRRIALALVVLLATASLSRTWPVLTTPFTTIDIAARKLESMAEPGDLIILNPWFFGISFNWYYRGRTPWITVPPIHDHRMHRYDLVRERMSEAEPLADVFSRIDETLKGGHRVWLLGAITFPPAGKIPQPLPPAPHPQTGWVEEPYLLRWSEQVAAHLQRRGAGGWFIEGINPARGSDVENAWLFRVYGPTGAGN